MRKSALTFILSLVFTSACVPMRVRQYEAVASAGPDDRIRVSNRITPDSGTYYSFEIQGVLGSFLVHPSSDAQNQLEIKVYLTGQRGSIVLVKSEKIKFRYQEEEWQEVSGQLGSYRIPSGSDRSAPTAAQPSFGKSYTYSYGDRNDRETVTFKSFIPRKEQDLEIEFPEIKVGTVVLKPRILKFKWHSGWKMMPING